MTAPLFVTCDFCGRRLPLANAIAVWDRDQPEVRRFVCRPSLSNGPPCFRERTRSVYRQAIALATEVPY